MEISLWHNVTVNGTVYAVGCNMTDHASDQINGKQIVDCYLWEYSRYIQWCGRTATNFLLSYEYDGKGLFSEDLISAITNALTARLGSAQQDDDQDGGSAQDTKGAEHKTQISSPMTQDDQRRMSYEEIQIWARGYVTTRTATATKWFDKVTAPTAQQDGDDQDDLSSAYELALINWLIDPSHDNFHAMSNAWDKLDSGVASRIYSRVTAELQQDGGSAQQDDQQDVSSEGATATTSASRTAKDSKGAEPISDWEWDYSASVMRWYVANGKAICDVQIGQYWPFSSAGAKDTKRNLTPSDLNFLAAMVRSAQNGEHMGCESAYSFGFTVGTMRARIENPIGFSDLYDLYLAQYGEYIAGRFSDGFSSAMDSAQFIGKAYQDGDDLRAEPHNDDQDSLWYGIANGKGKLVSDGYCWRDQQTAIYAAQDDLAELGYKLDYTDLEYCTYQDLSGNITLTLECQDGILAKRVIVSTARLGG